MHLAVSHGLICTLEDAHRVIERYVDLDTDPVAAALCRQLRRASTPAEIEEATTAFRDWAEAQGIMITHTEVD
jgi:hypothetical protein